MTYDEAIKYIHSTLKFGSVLGLETISYLLSKMQNPQDKLKFIHIAGTNGKGSTSNYIASVLKNAGYKVGLYISPFVDVFNERIQINGNYIKNDELAEITSYVKTCIDEMVFEGKNHPTEFEIVTAIAFLYYYQNNCDFVVLEVGLGGRFDATNVIKSPLASVITKIGLDHMEYLGDTISKIAFEKCGIIKENSLVVSYPLQDNDAIFVIENEANNKNSKLFMPDIKSLSITSQTLYGSSFTYKNYKINLSMTGKHQIYNAITAICVLELLKEKYNVKIYDNNIIDGLFEVKFIGRMEIISKNPLIILDGAHNLDGMTALTSSLSSFLNSKKIIVVVGMLKDKDYKKCIDLLSPFCKKFIATTPNNPRALSAKALFDASSVSEKEYFENPKEAINYAISVSNADDIICVCGSLYLISDIRKNILN